MAVSNGSGLYTTASCAACHGAVDEQAGTVPGTALGPMFDVNNYLITSSSNLETYIATQMMNGRQGCAGDTTCEMQAAEIATYLKSLSTEKCPIPSMEFEAVIADFAGYTDWELVDYSTGLSNPGGLGEAHAARNDLFTRKTFKNAAALNSSASEYDVGSILIKETFTYTDGPNGLEKTITGPTGLLAMVKRGGDFNPDNNGWEWFMLEPDLSGVIAQGEMPNGAAGCNACHSKAETQMGGWDYTFPKPTEFVADSSLFSNYTSWDLIEFDENPSNLFGGAHIDNAKNRRVFQKQVYANPTEAGAWGYPIGTAIVKDISNDDGIAQIVAMVKRGGNFDPANGNWEYFMLDPTDPSQVAMMDGNEVRGAVPMCIGCHEKAKDSDGMDYIFKHQHAPFNSDSAGQYIATKASLMDYTQWTVTDYALDNSNPLLAMAHESAKEVYSRQVFENEKASMQTGTDTYMPGSIIAKEVFTTIDGDKSFAGIFAMIKRGGTFNPDHGAWEWMILDGQSNVLERGSNLKDGGCNNCHEKAMGAAGVDYTFNKPSVITADEAAVKAIIANYKQWTLVQEATGAPAANVGGHAAGGNIVRKTYKKQDAANPYVEADQYPVGTVYVKEIVNNGSVGTIYGMVKSSTNWTWFTTNAAMSSVTFYNGTACSDCHRHAGNPDRIAIDSSYMGKDFVFYKENDPVPMPVSMP